MLLLWIDFMFFLGGGGEPWLHLPGIDVPSCSWSSLVVSVGCLLVLNFFFKLFVSALTVTPNIFLGLFEVDVY